MSKGSVTFLDVLGWKGIWLRRSPHETIANLQNLVSLAKQTAEHLRGSTTVGDVQVLSISDTIVLLTEGPPEETVQLHGKICAALIPQSIKSEIPIRGATAYGEFLMKDDRILVGPAVDEAAAWHEALDWIGVVLAPSAHFLRVAVAPWRVFERAPVKTIGARSMAAVDWVSNLPRHWDIEGKFAQAGPLEPLVAVKYLNTLSFVTEIRREQQGEPAEQAGS